MNPINVFIKDTILCPYKPFAQSLQLCVLFVTLWTVAHQAPLSMGFSRQDYSSGLPCPPPGDLPNPGIKPTSPALQVDSLPPSHQRSPISDLVLFIFLLMCLLCFPPSLLRTQKGPGIRRHLAQAC